MQIVPKLFPCQTPSRHVRPVDRIAEPARILHRVVHIAYGCANQLASWFHLLLDQSSKRGDDPFSHFTQFVFSFPFRESEDNGLGSRGRSLL